MNRRLAHLPTLLIAIGYPTFYLEMLSGTAGGGTTSMSAPLIFGSVAGWILLRSAAKERRFSFRSLRPTGTASTAPTILFALAVLGGAAAIAILSAHASMFPPHLGQEYDALNYHYTIPRQLLIRGSFAHIPWSAADLWPMPIQFGCAPYWFATVLPNKIPQFIFMLGLWAVVMRLGAVLAEKDGLLSSLIALAAVAGCHGIGVQYGTAMLDVALAYLFLAGIDSLREGDHVIFGVEFALFFWSKAFSPLQSVLIAVPLLAIASAARAREWKVSENFGGTRRIDLSLTRKSLLPFLAASLIFGAPFAFKSFYYAGTPLFPFFSGAFSPLSESGDKRLPELKRASDALMTVRDAYGHGRSPSDLIAHVWRMAVPEKGVNNAFDYPLGLPVLLLAGPFLWFFVSSIRQKNIPVIPLLGLLFWAVWWMGSQQTRWFYVPLCLIAISTAAIPRFRSSLPVQTGMVMAVGMTLLSVWGAHAGDIGKSRKDVLRERDVEIIEKSRREPEGFDWPYKDAAMATAPVNVVGPASEWVLAPPSRLTSKSTERPPTPRSAPRPSSPDTRE